jgi:hypothetical protein
MTINRNMLTEKEIKIATLYVIEQMIQDQFKDSKKGGVRNHSNQVNWTMVLAMQLNENMNTVPINCTGTYGNDTDMEYGIMVADPHSLEMEVIRCDFYSKLSNEAKYVLQVVYDSPVELVRLTARGVKAYLKNIGWKNKVIKQVFSELREYTECF